VVRCYARWARRTLDYGGRPHEPLKGKPLPPDVVLEKPDLPDPAEWKQALDKAGQCLGVTLSGRFLNPENLVRLKTELEKRVDAAASPCREVPALLAARAQDLRFPETTDRLTTARSADELCVALRGKSGVEQVRVLVGYEPKTSGSAMLHHMGSVESVAALLRDDLVFGVFEQLRGRSIDLVGAAELVDDVQTALRQDEVNVSLVARLRDLARQGQKLLQPPLPDKSSVLFRDEVSVQGGPNVRVKLDQLVSSLRAKLDEEGDDVELQGTLTLKKGS
jgi:hypothetical protein